MRRAHPIENRSRAAPQQFIGTTPMSQRWPASYLIRVPLPKSLREAHLYSLSRYIFRDYFQSPLLTILVLRMSSRIHDGRSRPDGSRGRSRSKSPSMGDRQPRRGDRPERPPQRSRSRSPRQRSRSRSRSPARRRPDRGRDFRSYSRSISRSPKHGRDRSGRHKRRGSRSESGSSDEDDGDRRPPKKKKAEKRRRRSSRSRERKERKKEKKKKVGLAVLLGHRTNFERVSRRKQGPSRHSGGNTVS